MEYNKLVSISGMSGLFELMSSKADGGIVRSLEDKSTKFVSTRLHSFSHIESVEIYTKNDNVNLTEVLEAVQNNSEPLPDANDAKALRSYFENVFPDMDFERVYGSDMKKIIKWYGQLKANNVEIKLSENAGKDGGSHEAPTTKGKASEPRQVSAKAAPPKKINSPRKMA